MFDRLELLVGNSNLKKIQNTKVLLIGIGGVGGYTLESLIRSGIQYITIVDYDKIDISNLNRQIISNINNIDKYKVDEFKKRINDINPDAEVSVIKEKINKDNFNILNISKYDYVIDACDSIDVKKEVIKECLKNNIKFISCMGTGYKLEPSKLEIIDLRKTSYDPIAKILRSMVKKERLKGKIPVVCSKEVIKKRTNVVASNSYVPATAGLLLTSYVINDIVGDLNENN